MNGEDTVATHGGRNWQPSSIERGAMLKVGRCGSLEMEFTELGTGVNDWPISIKVHW